MGARSAAPKGSSRGWDRAGGPHSPVPPDHGASAQGRAGGCRRGEQAGRDAKLVRQ